jgi:hypothetical protein
MVIQHRAIYDGYTGGKAGKVPGLSFQAIRIRVIEQCPNPSGLKNLRVFT